MLPCALHVMGICARATSMQGEDSFLCCSGRECCSKADTAEACGSTAVQVLVFSATIRQDSGS